MELSTGYKGFDENSVVVVDETLMNNHLVGLSKTGIFMKLNNLEMDALKKSVHTATHIFAQNSNTATESMREDIVIVDSLRSYMIESGYFVDGKLTDSAFNEDRSIVTVLSSNIHECVSALSSNMSFKKRVLKTSKIDRKEDALLNWDCPNRTLELIEKVEKANYFLEDVSFQGLKETKNSGKTLVMTEDATKLEFKKLGVSVDIHFEDFLLLCTKLDSDDSKKLIDYALSAWRMRDMFHRVSERMYCSLSDAYFVSFNTKESIQELESSLNSLFEVFSSHNKMRDFDSNNKG